MTKNELNILEYQIAGLREASALRNAVSAFGNNFEKMALPDNLAIDSVSLVMQISAIETELKKRIRETRRKLTDA